MYTIKQASIRTGVSVPLLRAWERRYGIPSPARTASGYRLYDDEAIGRVRLMHDLVATGWAPSQAAVAVLDGTARAGVEGTTAGQSALAEATAGPATAAAAAAARVTAATAVAATASSAPGALGGPRVAAGEELVSRFVSAARALDEAGLELVLDEAFAALGIDEAIVAVALPALVAVGEAWSAGTLDVAAEHAASQAVMRRFGAVYEAVGRPPGRAEVLVGLPPGARHEAGALAFAVACRRAGLRVAYLGADVPVESWRRAATDPSVTAVVLAAVTPAEAAAAASVAAALRADRPALLVAAGGAGTDEVTPEPAGEPGREPAGAITGVALRLPADLAAAVATLQRHLVPASADGRRR